MANRDDELNKFKDATVAAVKALSETPEIEITFSGNDIVHGQSEIVLPEPSASTLKSPDSIRGAADSIALKLRYHDRGLHNRLQPDDNEASAIFDALEQARYEALGARDMAGVSQNLNTMHEAHAKRQGFHRAKVKDDVPLHEALRAVAYAAFTNGSINDVAEPGIKLWRSYIKNKLDSNDLDALGGVLDNQERFGELIYDLMQNLGMAAEPNAAQSQSDESENDAEAAEPENDQNEDQPETGGPEEEQAGMPAPSQDEMDVRPDGSSDVEVGLEEDGSTDDSGDENAQSGSPDYTQMFDQDTGNISAYRIYTTSFDEIVHAPELCD